MPCHRQSNSSRQSNARARQSIGWRSPSPRHNPTRFSHPHVPSWRPSSQLSFQPNQGSLGLFYQESGNLSNPAPASNGAVAASAMLPEMELSLRELPLRKQPFPLTPRRSVPRVRRCCCSRAAPSSLCSPGLPRARSWLPTWPTCSPIWTLPPPGRGSRARPATGCRSS